MNENTQVIPRFGNLGVIACLLVDRLKNGTPGDVVTDAELTALCGYDTSPASGTRGRGYNGLLSAIHYCERERGVIWRRVTGENRLQCSDDEDIYHETTSRLNKVRRDSKRAVRIASRVDVSKLPEGDAELHKTRMLVAGTIASITTTKAIKEQAKEHKCYVPNLEEFTKK